MAGIEDLQAHILDLRRLATDADRIGEGVAAVLGGIAIDESSRPVLDRLFDEADIASSALSKIFRAVRSALGPEGDDDRPDTGEAKLVSERLRRRDALLRFALGHGPFTLNELQEGCSDLSGLRSTHFSLARADGADHLAAHDIEAIWDKPGASRGRTTQYQLVVSDEPAVVRLLEAKEESADPALGATESEVASHDDAGEQLSSEEIASLVLFYILGRKAISLSTLRACHPLLAELSFEQFQEAQNEIVIYLDQWGVVATWRVVGEGETGSYQLVVDVDPGSLKVQIWPEVEVTPPVVVTELASEEEDHGEPVGSATSGSATAEAVSARAEELTIEEARDLVLVSILEEAKAMTLNDIRSSNSALRTLTLVQFEEAQKAIVSFLADNNIIAEWRATDSGRIRLYRLQVSDEAKAKALVGLATKSDANRHPTASTKALGFRRNRLGPNAPVFLGQPFDHYWPAIRDLLVQRGSLSVGNIARMTFHVDMLETHEFTALHDGLWAKARSGELITTDNGKTFSLSVSASAVVPGASLDAEETPDPGNSLSRMLHETGISRSHTAANPKRPRS